MNREDVDALISSYRREGLEDSEDEDDELDGSGMRRAFVDTTWFNLVVGVVIAANALVIGLEADANSMGRTDKSLTWYLLELAFCLLFSAELVLRICYHGLGYFVMPMPGPRRCCGGWKAALISLPDRAKFWNILDLFIVIMSVVDLLIFVPSGSGGSARFISMLRFLRLLRLIRLVRLFKIFKELWLVANGLINAVKTLFWVCVMIFLVCYMAAIFATLWVGHNNTVYDPYFRQSGWDHEVYFATVMRSVLTLFQIVTLDQWSDGVVRHVIKNQPGMLIFFILIICVVTFGLLNIIVGVVVENALSTAARDQHKMKKARDRDRSIVFGQLKQIFEDADKDRSGTLTFEEVYDAIQKPEIYNKLRMIDFPVDDPEHIFNLLDYDESGELTIEEFITGCLRMKGNAKSKDLLVAQVALDCMKKHYHQFEKELEALQHKIARLDATARAIMDHGERVFLDMRQYRMRHPDERRDSIPRMETRIMEQAPWELARVSEPEQGTTIMALTGGPEQFKQAQLADASYALAHTALHSGPAFGGSHHTLKDAPGAPAILDGSTAGEAAYQLALRGGPR